MNLLALKIDVDTYAGMKRGVPRLLELLSRAAICGTFFLSVGPDASGLAVWQMIKNPRFLKKMIRTRAPTLYGWRTALYGTLLPSPMIALSFPELVKRIRQEGHEVQFHAWDHRRWQDSLTRRDERWIRDWFNKGFSAFRTVVGTEATAFGAPAWLVDHRVVAILREYPLDYVSCTRAAGPFVHRDLGMVEIPSDLPALEETGLEKGREIIGRHLARGGIHVLPVHAELEGGIGATVFENLINDFKDMGYVFRTLDELRRTIDMDALEMRSFRLALLPGRAVPCCV
ncbi:MAG: polysaccharide deacetylase family protein [Syntrophales bacterium]|nr:polysaccharide deacetylase family protein [Syntrophales bacterium]